MGGIYLKPFVFRQYHSLIRGGASHGGFSSFVLEDLGLTTHQLSTDLIRYIERATTASAIVSGELHGSAKMAAEAAVHDHTLGVLYSLRGLSSLLSFSKAGVVDGCNEDDGCECAGQVVALLMHHTTPLFACASGHMTGTPFVLAQDRHLELSIAAFDLLQSACHVQKVQLSRVSSSVSSASNASGPTCMTATGEMFAKSVVEAGKKLSMEDVVGKVLSTWRLISFLFELQVWHGCCWIHFEENNRVPRID